jgi:hypothetical protein
MDSAEHHDSDDDSVTPSESVTVTVTGPGNRDHSTRDSLQVSSWQCRGNFNLSWQPQARTRRLGPGRAPSRCQWPGYGTHCSTMIVTQA